MGGYRFYCSYPDAASDSVAGFALVAEGPALAVAFEEFAVVRVKSHGIGIPARLPVQRITLRRQTNPDRTFGTWSDRTILSNSVI